MDGNTEKFTATRTLNVNWDMGVHTFEVKETSYANDGIAELLVETSARKRAAEIVRNGFGFTQDDGSMLFLPTHRIVSVTIEKV